jgi:hypothetical protein
MIEFFVESVQMLCVAGLLCGAYYSIAYARELAPDGQRENPRPVPVGAVTNRTTPRAHV